MFKNMITLLLFLLLNACSTIPSGPSVLVLPGTGKDYEQFHKDDQMCRQLAHSQLTTSPKQPGDSAEGQQNYDISFIQCMYGKGHRMPVPGELMYDPEGVASATSTGHASASSNCQP